MFEINEDGGNPLVVGACPTGSSKTATTFLHHHTWEEDEVVDLIESVLGIDCSGVAEISFGKECGFTFQLKGCDVADGAEWQVWSTKNFSLEVDHDSLLVNHDVLGNVLANYKFGKLESVYAYLDSIAGSETH